VAQPAVRAANRNAGGSQNMPRLGIRNTME
jgi:hypothetical protein